MNREQFGVLVKAMKAVYSEPKFIPDKDAFDVWYNLLKDLDYDMASTSIQKYMMTNKFPPSIADIREQVYDIEYSKENELHEITAWTTVLKAIRNSSYNSEEEFSKLPIVLQKTVGDASQLREWAIMEDIDGKSMTVLQSNFMRSFRSVIEREKELQKLNPEVLKIIGNNYNQTTMLSKDNKTLTITEEREEAEKNKVPFTERIDNMIKIAKNKLRTNN